MRQKGFAGDSLTFVPDCANIVSVEKGIMLAGVGD